MAQPTRLISVQFHKYLQNLWDQHFQPPNSVYADVISEYKPFLRGNARKHGQFMSDGYAFSMFITIHKVSRRRY